MTESFARDFKRFFFRGLAAGLPTILTIWAILFALTWIHEHIAKYINIGLIWTVRMILVLPPGSRFESTYGVYFEWVGFVLALIGIYVFGRFVASFVGRTIWGMLEQAFFRLPVVKQIYPSVKQVTDFLFSERKIEFSRVVAVTYPRKGIWSVGFVTGEAMEAVRQASGEDLLTVFIPSSPTPFTGYTISVSRRDVVDLPISIDEALRFTISGGVIKPPGQQPRPLSGGETSCETSPPTQRKEITA